MHKICEQCHTSFTSDMDFCPKDGSSLKMVTSRIEDPLIGKELDGRYLIIERVGVGGMGKVYKALQKPINRHVAVKLLHRELTEDVEVVKRFYREAKAASLLSNPHSIVIHDFGQTVGELLYIVMEYLQGTVLTQEIQEKGAFTTKRALKITQQICESLIEAHENDIVHRDLKPANIYLSRAAGRSEMVKVLDFGIAKISQEIDQTRITKQGILLGTPLYMSPEQVKGLEVDGRSDIYSLGIILYEMLSGSTPFHALTPGNILLQQITVPPPPILDINPETVLFEELEGIVHKCLEKNRAQRYQNVQALQRDIGKALLKLESGDFKPLKPRNGTATKRLGAVDPYQETALSADTPESWPTTAPGPSESRG